MPLDRPEVILMPFFGPWPASVEHLPDRSPKPLEHRRSVADLVLDEKTRQRMQAEVVADLVREGGQRERLRRLFQRPAGPR